jgi:CRP/FNR family transcriptional regulator, dissimilatory nitrate respiration regulator
MSDGTVAFLATVPLLKGIPEPELAELARVLRRRDVPPGEILWSEGDDAAGMLLIVDGYVSVSLRLAGDRAVEVATMGPGEALGELVAGRRAALRDGPWGRRSGTRD